MCLPAVSPIQPSDVESVARKLVEAKKLTPFQVTELWKGKTQQLTLVLKKIGSGGMEGVYRARHRVMERVVAMKILPESVTKDENAIKRFRREVVAAARPHNSLDYQTPAALAAR